MSCAADIVLDNTALLADEANAATTLELGYLAARQRPTPPPFTQHPLTPGQRDIASAMIETVFSSMDVRLDTSLDVALSNEFHIP
jgi:nucleoside 2-deoxyribosyltransferase